MAKWKAYKAGETRRSWYVDQMPTDVYSNGEITVYQFDKSPKETERIAKIIERTLNQGVTHGTNKKRKIDTSEQAISD